jgi:hypothetical protein
MNLLLDVVPPVLFAGRAYSDVVVYLICQVFRGPHNLPLAVEKGMKGVSFDENSFLRLVPDTVVEPHAGPPHVFQFGFYNDDVIVPCGRKIMAV